MTEKHHYTPEAREVEQSPEEILRSILDTQRAPSPEYQSLIRKQEDRGSESRQYLTDDFAGHWFSDIDKEEAVKHLLQNHLVGKVIIDLGGGEGGMGEIARDLGASIYINVERAPYDESRPLNPSTPMESQRAENFLGLRVHADMLDFLSRLKDESVDNFVINGIDTYVIDRLPYHGALRQEILRTTKKGGLIFGRSSDVLDDIKKHLEARREDNLPTDLPVRLVRIKFTNGIFLEKLE